MANSAITALPAGTGALVYLATQTASASATIDFTSSIDATYNEYEIHILNANPATDGVQLHMRTSTDGGSTFDSGATDYKYAGQAYYTGATANYNSTGAAQLVLSSTGRTMGNVSGEGYCGVVRLTQPSSATITRVDWTGSYCGTAGASEHAVVHGSGRRDSAADVDAIRFLMSSGNIASGEFKLYGVSNS